MLQLIALLTLAQFPQHRLFLHPSAPRSAFAYFEFAPSAGQGMTPACACSAVTGAKGEAISVTRSTVATCSKRGLSATGYVAGDLVACASGKARVEPDSLGVMGARIEPVSTNIELRNEAMDNAVWVYSHTGLSAPTLNAVNIVDPFGNATAADISFPATTAGQESFVGQVVASGTYISSGWVKGAPGYSGTIDFSTNAAGNNTPCAFNDSTWSFCFHQATLAGTNHYYGNNTAKSGVDRPAQRVYIARLQVEIGVGGIPTSSIATAAVSVTRAADQYRATVASAGVRGCVSASFDGQSLAVTGPYATSTLMAMTTTSSPSYGLLLYQLATFTLMRTYVSTNVGSTSAARAYNGRTERGVARYTGTVSTTCINGACTSASPGLTLAAGAYVDIGYDGVYNLGQFNGIISRVQYDPDPTRCDL